jgi:hypothetical protein
VALPGSDDTAEYLDCFGASIGYRNSHFKLPLAIIGARVAPLLC